MDLNARRLRCRTCCWRMRLDILSPDGEFDSPLKNFRQSGNNLDLSVLFRPYPGLPEIPPLPPLTLYNSAALSLMKIATALDLGRPFFFLRSVQSDNANINDILLVHRGTLPGEHRCGVYLLCWKKLEYLQTPKRVTRESVPILRKFRNSTRHTTSFGRL